MQIVEPSTTVVAARPAYFESDAAFWTTPSAVHSATGLVDFNYYARIRVCSFCLEEHRQV